MKRRGPTSPPRPAKPAGAKSGGGELVVGRHPVLAVLEHKASWAKKLLLLDTGQSLEPLIDAARDAKVVVERVERRVLDDRAGAGLVHQGVVLEVIPFPYTHIVDALAEKPRLVVVLDCVEDPRNLGAIARAAVVFGAELIVLPRDRAAGVTAAAHKTAAGALAMIPVAQVENLARALDKIREAGIWIVGAEADGRSLTEVDLREPTAWVIGGEGKGLRRLTRERCDHVVSIPMVASPESGLMLNAADAATVVLYETMRQRSLLPRANPSASPAL